MADEHDTGELQSLYQDLMRRRAAQPDGGHPDAATWEALAASSLPSEQRDRTLAHVVACASCARTYRAIDALRREAPALESGTPAASPPRAGLAPRWLAPGLAAAAVVLVAVGVARMGDPVPPRDAPTSVTRSAPVATLVPIAPAGTLPAAPDRFRWEKWDAVETYRVLLFTGDGRPVWTSGDVAETELAWPSGIERLPGDYLWRVSGVRDGVVAAESRMTAFRIQ